MRDAKPFSVHFSDAGNPGRTTKVRDERLKALLLLNSAHLPFTLKTPNCLTLLLSKTFEG
jgi:hypothetical protein